MSVRVIGLEEMERLGVIARRADGMWVRVGPPPPETETRHVTPAFLEQTRAMAASKKKPSEDDIALLRWAEKHCGEEQPGVWTVTELWEFMEGGRS